MYGSRTRGLDGHTYDSGEEHAVAQALGQLQREQVVAGYMTHALSAGSTSTFSSSSARRPRKTAA